MISLCGKEVEQDEEDSEQEGNREGGFLLV